MLRLPDLFSSCRAHFLYICEKFRLWTIIVRKSIKENRLLEDIFIYLVNTASNLVSVRNIANYIKSTGYKASYDTVAAYIGYIEDAFLIHR